MEKKPTEQALKKQKNLLNRVNRVEGQIKGIKNMIEKGVYCDDIINQIEASRSALNSIEIILLENHIKSCVKERIQKGDDEIIEEVLKTIKRLTK